MRHSDHNRTLRIDTPFGPGGVVLTRFSGTESISLPYAFQLELLSDRSDLPFDRIVGQPVLVSLATSTGNRPFHGIVTRFVHVGCQGAMFVYRAEMRPWLWLLTQSANCRIFQHKTVPEIVELVFRDRGFTDFKFALLRERYPQLTYCVQYRETDFDFVSRLLEESGIHYWFEHQPNRHRLMLADGPDSHARCDGQSELPFHPTGGGAGTLEAVTDVTVEEQVTTNAVALQDFNFETPSLDLAVRRRDTAPGRRLEVYDYPGRYERTETGGSLAGVLLDGTRTHHRVAKGSSTCRTLSSGSVFTLGLHPRADVNTHYLLLEVTHMASEPAGYGPGMSHGESPYTNSFEAIPAAAPMRPRPITPKPRIHGTQTAIVVGPSGEEIYTDKYGRIKVQFHWDRDGRRNEQSSCWIRVSQPWAGKTWGGMFLPRVGQEVIVEFLEGDPDRPLVTGRVYNAEQMPPYDLPANKTRSTYKSRSSPGGGPANFNEIRIEDKMGQEEIYIHAERDHNQVTEHDRSEDVGNDRSLVVGHDKSERVKHDKCVTVDNDLIEFIKHDKTITVDHDHEERIVNDMSLTVSGNRTMTVVKDLTETVQADMRTTIQGSQQTTVQKDQSTSVSGSCRLTVDEDCDITVSKDLAATVSKDLTCTVDGDSTFETSKEHSIAAKKIVLEATDEIELKVGAASIKLSKTGEITAQGVTVAITGAATVTVKGGTILLN